MGHVYRGTSATPRQKRERTALIAHKPKNAAKPAEKPERQVIKIKAAQPVPKKPGGNRNEIGDNLQSLNGDKASSTIIRTGQGLREDNKPTLTSKSPKENKPRGSYRSKARIGAALTTAQLKRKLEYLPQDKLIRYGIRRLEKNETLGESTFSLNLSQNTNLTLFPRHKWMKCIRLLCLSAPHSRSEALFCHASWGLQRQRKEKLRQLTPKRPTELCFWETYINRKKTGWPTFPCLSHLEVNALSCFVDSEEFPFTLIHYECDLDASSPSGNSIQLPQVCLFIPCSQFHNCRSLQVKTRHKSHQFESTFLSCQVFCQYRHLFMFYISDNWVNSAPRFRQRHVSWIWFREVRQGLDTTCVFERVKPNFETV